MYCNENQEDLKLLYPGRGNKGFSLNGTHRNIGAVGTTNLGKSVTRTPFRGLKPMGNGGCCGRYVVNVSNSGSCCFGAPNPWTPTPTDAAYVKTSVKNTKGLLYSKKYYPTGQQYNYQVPAWNSPVCVSDHMGARYFSTEPQPRHIHIGSLIQVRSLRSFEEFRYCYTGLSCWM